MVSRIASIIASICYNLPWLCRLCWQRSFFGDIGRPYQSTSGSTEWRLHFLSIAMGIYVFFFSLKSLELMVIQAKDRENPRFRHVLTHVLAHLLAQPLPISALGSTRDCAWLRALRASSTNSFREQKCHRDGCGCGWQNCPRRSQQRDSTVNRSNSKHRSFGLWFLGKGWSVMAQDTLLTTSQHYQSEWQDFTSQLEWWQSWGGYISIQVLQCPRKLLVAKVLLRHFKAGFRIGMGYGDTSKTLKKLVLPMPGCCSVRGCFCSTFSTSRASQQLIGAWFCPA